MLDPVTDDACRRAALLATALGETVAELRLIEPGDLIGYIRAGQWANIGDLVQSSAEMYFREGALAFACMADFVLDWASCPSVALEMEFQSPAVSVFFTLFLDRDDGTVALRRVWFPAAPVDAAAGTRCLAEALADARVSYGTIAPLATRRR